MVKLSGKALAAGKIEANVSVAIPAASALPLTIAAVSPSQPQPLVLAPSSPGSCKVTRTITTDHFSLALDVIICTTSALSNIPAR